MFHPLVLDLDKLKDTDIDGKIAELNKKYSISARMGNGYVCEQISLVLGHLRAEQERRAFENLQKSLSKTNGTGLDGLINID